MLKKIASAVPMMSLQVALIGFLAVASALRAQDTSKLTYDVSTVKPHDPARPGGSFGARDGRFVAVNTGLRNLIAEGWAYGRIRSLANQHGLMISVGM